MLEFYYDFLDKYFSRQDFELCYLDTDSFHLAMSDESLDEIVHPWMRQTYEADKNNWLATDNLAREHLGYLSLNLLIQEVCGLPLSATLFKNKIRSGKVNTAVKVFQKSIMICVLSALKMSCMFFKRQE